MHNIFDSGNSQFVIVLLTGFEPRVTDVIESSVRRSTNWTTRPCTPMSVIFTRTPKERHAANTELVASPGEFWCLPPVWNLRAFSLISLFYISSFNLLPCPVALSVFPFLLLAHSPDLFSPKPPFSERYALLCSSFFFSLFLLSG